MLKPIIIALALLTAASPALANSQKLPFVGKRFIDSDYGVWGGYYITINKNGNTTISWGSKAGGDSTLYRGKYRQLLPINEGGSRAYLQIKNNKVYLLDRNKNLVYDCSFDGSDGLLEDQACIIPLRK
ncbi:hypothetical protein [Moraxella cuniculi]|uniref:Uncharacterized protein n=1 Tax=Moraxella cuniculi TaxID=34061 RepID=A0A3S4SZZ6_9GAMM|nr:hypothetical protein [Moraxella cuniculi]VEG13649.1 Uncharacterised protein [Moraxella cuniculi]